MANINKSYDPKPITTSTTSCIKKACFSKNNEFRKTKSSAGSALSQKTNKHKK